MPYRVAVKMVLEEFVGSSEKTDQGYQCLSHRYFTEQCKESTKSVVVPASRGDSVAHLAAIHLRPYRPCIVRLRGCVQTELPSRQLARPRCGVL